MSILLEEEVQRVLGRRGLAGRGVLAALSGGVDSVCLVRTLAALARRGGVRVEAAHVDHGLRPDSASDARFCAELAGRLGVPFHCRRLDRGDFRKGESVQAEARRLRREALEDLRRERGLDATALGHHADDQAETVLLRLVRGAGPRGVAGMAEWAPPWLRPLLAVRRSEIEAAAAAGGWEHRVDPSNRDPRYLRSRLRHELLPLLRSLNPSVEKALTRFAGLAAADDEVLTTLAEARFRSVSVREPEGWRMPAAALRDLEPALRRRLYLAAWQELGLDPAGLELRHLEAVDALLGPGRSHRVAPTPGPGAFARSYADLWALGPATPRPFEGSVTLARPGRAALPGTGVTAVWGGEPPAGRAFVALPAAVAPGALTLRSRRPGDRLGDRKVKDLLMEARLPRWRRDRAAVVEGAGGGVTGVLAAGAAWGGSAAELRGGAVWLEDD